MTRDLMKFVDAGIGVLLCRTLGRLHFMFSRQREPSRIDPDSIHRILVLRPGGMGDMIVLLPVLRRLRSRFPDAAIDVVCERRNVSVLDLAGIEAAPLVYDANPFRFLAGLRRRRYDAAIDTEQFHNFSALFAWFSGAPARIGFKINPHRNPLYTHLVNYQLDGLEGEQFLALLGPLGIDGEPYALPGALAGLVPALPAPGTETGTPATNPPFVVIHAGGSSAYKLWPAERFVELAAALHEQHGLGVFLAGDRNDRRVNGKIRDGLVRAGCSRVSCANGIDLRQTAGAMARARLFVGTDSGLAHLATALGLATVVIFGPSDHAKWGLQDATHAVVRQALPCSPCFIFGYHRPCRTIACMQHITVEDVLAACNQVLGKL